MFIETSRFSFLNDAVFIETYTEKISKVSIITKSTPASLGFKGQATKPTNIKWYGHRLHGIKPVTVTVTVTVTSAGNESQCG